MLYNSANALIVDTTLDLIQLYSATQRVVKSLETSGMMPALKAYRASLRGHGNIDIAQAQLTQATDAYIAKTAMFGEHEASVVNLLHLGQIGTSSFWIDLTSNVRPVEARQAQAVSAYSKMMFASSHLPSLLALVRETSAVEGLRSDDSESGRLVLRLYDSVESAASPDRMSRLIDSVDMLYTACSSIAGVANDSLQLMSVSGVAVRTLIFHGELQAINATQRVILYLNQVAAVSHQNEDYSVESIADHLPFLQAIDDLEHINAIDRHTASTAINNTREGAIMLLESGAQLIEFEPTEDTSSIPPSVIAKLDADAKSFDLIDASISDSIDQRYDQLYDDERQRLINESQADSEANPADSDIAARGERIASKGVGTAPAIPGREDSIDDLIIDLNRLYGEQRNAT